MSSPVTSPRTKALRLSRKNKNEDEHGQNKRMKTDSADAKLDALKKENFMKACLQVSYEAYIDFKKRFQLIHFPACIDNQCIHIEDKNAKIQQIPPTSEQYFNIEMKNKTWFEAVEVCLMCITSKQYLSANMLKDIVEIIMNAHEDDVSGYSIEYILRQCQHTLLLHFRMHPPCITKGIRECYKKFLTSPMTKKDNTLSNRAHYCSEEGIVSHCMSRLLYEISVESRDDALIDKQEVPEEIDEAIQKIYWKKDSFGLFEFLDRPERIERLMLVLECLIGLLQTDLALWHSRRFGTNGKMRSQRPLLAYVLWPINCLTNGAVTQQCHKIMEIYAYFIHLKYPEHHIKTMSLWMNAVIQMFYMYETHAHVDYPNTSSCCAAFAKQFCKIISPLPPTSISRILERIQPYFMQHLIGLHLIKTMLCINQTDIILIIISSIKNSWENYPDGDNVAPLPSIGSKSKVKPHKLLELLSKKCKNHLSASVENTRSGDESTNHYPKLDLQKETYKINKNHFINLLFITFVAYLETHSITNFNQTLNRLNENLNSDPSSRIEFEVSSYEPYTVSDHFVKKYRSIIESLQTLIKILASNDTDEPSKNLFNIINHIFS